jgi:hypothetical protein
MVTCAEAELRVRSAIPGWPAFINCGGQRVNLDPRQANPQQAGGTGNALTQRRLREGISGRSAGEENDVSKTDDAAALARRRAQDLLDRHNGKDADRFAERDKQRQLEAAKTARLRELRLAKEAAERAEKQAAKQARTARPRGAR